VVVVRAWRFELTVDSRRADNSSLDGVCVLDAGFEHDFVDIAVESVVRQVGDLLYAGPVIVFLLRPLSERVVVVIHVSQDTSATSVQVVTRVFLRVTRANSLSNGLRSALVIGSIRGVYRTSQLETFGGAEFYLQLTQNDIGFSSLLLQHVGVIIATKHDANIRESFLNNICFLLRAYERGVFVVGVFLIQSV
jgi:hypothetical protein